MWTNKPLQGSGLDKVLGRRRGVPVLEQALRGRVLTRQWLAAERRGDIATRRDCCRFREGAERVPRDRRCGLGFHRAVFEMPRLIADGLLLCLESTPKCAGAPPMPQSQVLRHLQNEKGPALRPGLIVKRCSISKLPVSKFRTGAARNTDPTFRCPSVRALQAQAPAPFHVSRRQARRWNGC
jgi:hypothetical protein